MPKLLLRHLTVVSGGDWRHSPVAGLGGPGGTGARGAPGGSQRRPPPHAPHSQPAPMCVPPGHTPPSPPDTSASLGPTLNLISPEPRTLVLLPPHLAAAVPEHAPPMNSHSMVPVGRHETLNEFCPSASGAQVGTPTSHPLLSLGFGTAPITSHPASGRALSSRCSSSITTSCLPLQMEALGLPADHDRPCIG